MTLKCKRILGKGSNQVRIMSDNTVRYRYELNDNDGYCEFSLYCEIGEPYKPVIDYIIREFNIVIGEPLETVYKPYFADTVISVNGEAI